MESDEKTIPGQFDSAEQSITLNEESSQKSQSSDRIVNDEKSKHNIYTDTHIDVDALPIKKDNINDSVSVTDLVETNCNEKNTIPHSPTLVTTETERELANIESTIPENTIVEEAAA